MVELDLRGEVCPFTFVRTKLRLEELPLGAELCVLLDHPAAARNVPRSLVGEGQEVLSVVESDGVWRVTARKASEHRLVTSATRMG